MRFQSLLAVAVLTVAPILFAVGSASAAAPPLNIDPNPASAGDTVTVSGAGCVAQPGDPKGDGPLVYLSIEGQPLPDAITPAADGKWSYSFDLPTGIPDVEATFTAVCDDYTSSFNYAPNTLTVNGDSSGAFILLPNFLNEDKTPALTAGAEYEIVGLGFEPGEEVSLILHSTPVKLATFTADDTGTVDGRFTIPANTPGGAHTLEMTGLESGISATEAISVIPQSVAVTTVTISPTPTAVSGPASTVTLTTVPVTTSSEVATSLGPVLAATGTAATSLTAVGAALTLGGVGTLLVARRKRGSRSH